MMALLGIPNQLVIWIWYVPYGCQTTTVVYGTVWPQFATHVLTRCCDPPVWEEDVVVLGLGMVPG